MYLIFRGHDHTEGDTTMFHAQIRDLRTNWNRSMLAALACTLLVASAASPSHAQYTLTDIYDFNCSTGGCDSIDYGQLTRGTDGYLYGTAGIGGTSNAGTIFKVLPDGTSYSDLWEFDATTGSPIASLILASDGNFYGGTINGGTYGEGTLFRFIPPNTLKILHECTGADGCGPYAAPFEYSDGNLYGGTVFGTGQVYRVNPKTGVVATLKNKTPIYTFAPLMQASDTYMYGTTDSGGTNDWGTVFRLTTGGAIKTIYNFTNGADGFGPSAPIFQGSDGNLYGSAAGGTSNDGTVFQLILGKTTTFNLMHSFVGTDGLGPSGLVAGASVGSLLGVTLGGGKNGGGTAFEISMVSPFPFTKVADFLPVSPANPFGPEATLLPNTDGSYYGVSQSGGLYGDGYLFKLTPFNPLLTVIVEGPVWVHPGVPVVILGDNLGEVINVTFAGMQASFQPGSNTYLTALVPSAAVDGPLVVTITNPAGGQEQLQGQQNMHILPIITNLDPTSGPVGTGVGIVGGGFVGATHVTFGGVKATSFTVDTPTLIHATVPVGAKTGKVAVKTPNGTATSKQTFTVN